MSVKKRIRMCLLIEKMLEQKEFAEQLGMEDVSTFRGKKVGRKEGKKA